VNTAQTIPATYEQLLPQFLLLSKNHETLQGEYALLKAELAQLKRMMFGAKSERFAPSANASQQELPLGVEATAEVETKQQQITYTRTITREKENPNHKGRLPLPAHLPRVVIELQPEEKVEGCTVIGEEITEELDYTPGKLFVNQYVRKKYAAKEPERIITASLPSRPIDKGIPAPGLLAQILIDKYVDHLPLYRQQQRFIREGVRIAESTLCD
jgi:transposase